MVTYSVIKSDPGAMNLRNKPKETHKVNSSPQVSKKVTEIPKRKPCFSQGQKGRVYQGCSGNRAASSEREGQRHAPPSFLELLCVTGCGLFTETLLSPHSATHPPNTPLPSPHPRPASSSSLALAEGREGYVRMLDMNSLKRFEYCSGFTVEISAPAPCFTVLAACAAFFLASYGVRMSMTAMK